MSKRWKILILINFIFSWTLFTVRVVTDKNPLFQLANALLMTWVLYYTLKQKAKEQGDMGND